MEANAKMIDNFDQLEEYDFEDVVTKPFNNMRNLMSTNALTLVKMKSKVGKLHHGHHGNSMLSMLSRDSFGAANSEDSDPYKKGSGSKLQYDGDTDEGEGLLNDSQAGDFYCQQEYDEEDPNYKE